MKIKDFSAVLWAFMISAMAFLIHKGLFYLLFPQAETAFAFPLLTIYGFFTACCVAITLTSVFIKGSSVHSVGQFFMLLTFVEMALCFGLFYSGLSSSGTSVSFEKGNFIIVFLFFLAIETILTIRLLNKNQ
ncbi:hypothetical protein [Flavobacterium pallidum]|uniref:Uncharacterized protein n=1 Tax=Flavobacterium pallidum TaxID=2172098 RepID=A0A2S1SF70_9FLAO|nr:hypothetical protein [Flavobacterium pallidum]AWI25050.1 hypothetical protein HYN49_03590 [Flavobacterium pallidum]